MINLTCDEDSAVDLHAEWKDDKFVIYFRFNHDDKEDLEVGLVLAPDEFDTLVEYLIRKANVIKDVKH